MEYEITYVCLIHIINIVLYENHLCCVFIAGQYNRARLTVNKI